MNITAWGKLSLALALFGAVGMGFGIAAFVRAPETGENGVRPKVEAPLRAVEETGAENRDTQPAQSAKIELPPREGVETRQAPAASVHDTSIVERMLANEKRLGDALFVLRRDLKTFYDTMDMRLARLEARGTANGARATGERVEKSVVARRALQEYLNR